MLSLDYQSPMKKKVERMRGLSFGAGGRWEEKEDKRRKQLVELGDDDAAFLEFEK